MGGRAKQLAQVAETLKKQKATYEEARKRADDAVALLKEVVPSPPASLTEAENAVKEAAKAYDWERAEKAANKLKEEADKGLQVALKARQEELQSRADRFVASSGALPTSVDPEIERAKGALERSDYPGVLSALKAWDTALSRAEKGQTEAIEERVRAIVRWAGREREYDVLSKRLGDAFALVQKGDLKAATKQFDILMPVVVPEAYSKLKELIESQQKVLEVARDLQLETAPLARALEEGTRAKALVLDRAAEGIESARRDLEARLRPQAIEYVRELRRFLDTLKEEGADLARGLGPLDEATAELPKASPADIARLVGKARETIGGIAMSVVTAYLDEVRPRLLEARQLGRNPAPAMEEVTRAREAFLKKEFERAVRSAQRALEISSELVADLEAGHEEVTEFKQLLNRLASGGLSSPAYQEIAKKAEEALRANELEKMRQLVQDGLKLVGRECLPFFRSQLESQRRLLDRVDDHGWGTSELPQLLKETRQHFQEGRFAETAESLSAFKAALRAAVAPHLAHRLEELGKAVDEVTDPEAVAPVRRLMAETDIALKVREDAEAAMESLAKTEKELAVTFAARASSLVDELEDERQGLGQMGVDTERISQEIAQIHQIFDASDFLNASRSSRELKARLLQRQLLRAEEQVSKAKFALVELAKMGLEPASLKEGLADASERLRSGRYPAAYQRGTQVLEEASKVRSTALKVREEIASLAEIIAGLRKNGVQQEELQSVLPKARVASEAYQRMDFDRALAQTAELKAALQEIGQRRESQRLAKDLDLLFAGARLLGASDSTWEGKLRLAQASLASGNAKQAAETLKEFAPQAIEGVRTALENQLRALQGDLRAARSAGLDTTQVEGSLADARRAMGESLPLGVAEIIDKSRREFFQGRAFLDQAQKAVAAAREAVNQGELVRADISDLKPRLEEVERRFAAGELTVTLDLAQKLHRDAEDRVRGQVTKTLASFQAMINHAKMDGAITAVAENLLVQARNLLINGKPLEALRLATRSETELERVELQHSLATNALITLKGKLDDAKEKGVRAPDAEREIARAEDMMSRGDYSGVLERSLEGGELLLRASEQRRRATEAIEATQRFLGTLSGLEADLSLAQGDLEKARGLQAEGSYADAQALARTAGETARNLVESLMTLRMSDVRLLLETLRALDPEGANAYPPRIAKAEEALKSRDWRTSLDRLKEVRQSLQVDVEKLLVKEQDRLQSLWRALPAADPKERDGSLVAMEQARSAGDLVRYRQLLNAAFTAAGEFRRRHLDEQFAEVERRVLLGERLGVDMTPVMESFSEIKMNLRTGPIEPLLEQLGKTEVALAKLIATRLSDRASEISGDATFARDGLSMNVGPVMTLLAEVDQLQRQDDVVGAAKKLVEAEQELARRKELHWQLTNTQFVIDQTLTTLTERKVDIGPLREMLLEATRAKETDSARALELSQKALEGLKRLLEDGSPAGSSGSAAAAGAPKAG